MGINFWGVVHGTKAFLPHLEASGEGHVVNISSVFGLHQHPVAVGLQRQPSSPSAASPTPLRRSSRSPARACRAPPCTPAASRPTSRATAAWTTASPSATGQSADASTRELEKAFITTPGKAAAVIIGAVQKNKRRVLVGPDARVFDAMARVAPAGYQRLITGVVRSRAAR